MKEAVSAVFLILAVSQTSSKQVVSCSPGWVLNGTSCYFVQTNLTEKLTFMEANEWCDHKWNGSFLTSVLSQKENDFLDHLINSTKLRPNETFYIGLDIKTKHGRLEWEDSKPYNYTNWYNNNSLDQVKDNRQRCAYYNHLHKWQLDDGCKTERLFICKQLKSISVSCSPGWALNGTSCYYVETNLTQKRTFWLAKKWCKKLNGSILASVLSQRENDFLDHLINNTKLRNETFYIGLRTLNNGTVLAWVGRASYNYTNWYNNSKPELLEDNKQRCTYYNHLHKWQLEYGCRTKRLFICKQLLSILVDGNGNHTSGNNTLATRTTARSNTIGSTPRESPIISRVSSASTEKGLPTVPTTQEKPDETLRKLNNLLDSLEGATLNQSSAKRNMKELGTGLDSVVNSGSQPVDQLSQVITTSERIGELMVKGLRRGNNITEPASIQIQTGSIVLGVDILPPVQSINSAESVSFPGENKQAGNINLPASLMWRAQQQDGVSISSLLLSNVSVTADPQSSKVLNSAIISSTILFNNGSKFQNLSEPVAMNFSSVIKANDSQTCVFLDVNTDPPSWSSSGCVVHKYSSSHTECHCYHMTSFAVLMDIHGAYEDDAISEDHELALSIISIVGCLIAFICYIALLFSFYFLRRRTETLSIHMNLAAAQSLAIFFFLVGFPGVRIKGVCYTFAVLLHYFQLASFCWMMAEGINLLRGMVKVFRVTSRLKIYSVFAWGVPVLVVAVTASLARDQYLRDDFCWISHQIIWSFAGPVALILSVNLGVLIVAIKIVVRRARYKETSTISALELEIRAAFKTLVILVPLLGLTWILGYISIHSKSLVFQYLFAVINSMQGLYFLISQYCFDDDIKTNAHRASTRVKRLFTLSTSKSTSSLSSTRGSNKRTAVSPQQKAIRQDDHEKNSNNQKQSSNDQDNNDEHLACNQQSNLDQQNLNAIPTQLQGKTTDDPNSEVNPAQDKIDPEPNVRDTQF